MFHRLVYCFRQCIKATVFIWHRTMVKFLYRHTKTCQSWQLSLNSAQVFATCNWCMCVMIPTHKQNKQDTIWLNRSFTGRKSINNTSIELLLTSSSAARWARHSWFVGLHLSKLSQVSITETTKDVHKTHRHAWWLPCYMAINKLGSDLCILSKLTEINRNILAS
jgi:hypothetical protein